MNVAQFKSMVGIGVATIATTWLTMVGSPVEIAQAAYPNEDVLQQTTNIVFVQLDDTITAANIRSGPGLDFEVIDTVKSSDVMTVIGQSSTGEWLQIQHDDQTGWLATWLVEKNSHLSTLPVIIVELSESNVEPIEEVDIWTKFEQSVSAPTCADQPIRGFGEAWHNHPEVQPRLGCVFTNWRRDEHATASAIQQFEHGWMLWLETDTVANVDPIYVFYEDDGSYIRFGDRALVDAHSFSPTPSGFHKVGDRFAKVYWEEIGTRNRARLGQAINEAQDSSGAFQEFENGRMFWSKAGDRIFVIHEGWYLIDNESTRLRGWLSYQDTFEE